ncbi:G1/S-specific cyclin-D1-like [Acipenser ruthenus]|uniref:G1/S-specific cyclin-D1-like n=1 Tax=Acipenser ruthenus TaxID=7906 RepID=UPI0027406F3A|nr:G1/S-specific cyclin-D1-like [Acipenser ruthenus]
MDSVLWCCESDRLTLRAPLDPALSGRRALDSLLRTEERYLPSPLYFSEVQTGVQPPMRGVLASWLLELCCEHACSEEVFALALSLLDRVLSLVPMQKSRLQLLGAACLFLASKLRQSEALPADSLSRYSDRAFTAHDLRDMERMVLTKLGWDVAAVTPQDFLPHFLSAVGLSADGEDQYGDLIRKHCQTLITLCVSDITFLATPPSIIAASCLSSALKGLACKRGPSNELGLSIQLACLINTDPEILLLCSGLIEAVLSERIGNGERRRGEREGKNEATEEEEVERSTTPTDFRDINL